MTKFSNIKGYKPSSNQISQNDIVINTYDRIIYVKNLAGEIIDICSLYEPVDYLLSAEFGNSLPTSDPSVVGEIWNNSGVMTVSAG